MWFPLGKTSREMFSLRDGYARHAYPLTIHPLNKPIGAVREATEHAVIVVLSVTGHKVTFTLEVKATVEFRHDASLLAVGRYEFGVYAISGVVEDSLEGLIDHLTTAHLTCIDDTGRHDGVSPFVLRTLTNPTFALVKHALNGGVYGRSLNGVWRNRCILKRGGVRGDANGNSASNTSKQRTTEEARSLVSEAEVLPSLHHVSIIDQTHRHHNVSLTF